MHLSEYLQLAKSSEQQLATALMKVAKHHTEEPDMYFMCEMLAAWSHEHAEKLEPVIVKYSPTAKRSKEPGRISDALFKGPRKGEIALLRDLHDLWLLTKEIEITWSCLMQAAMALHDKDLEELITILKHDTSRQTDWLLTRIKNSAPQILIAAE